MCYMNKKWKKVPPCNKIDPGMQVTSPWLFLNVLTSFRVDFSFLYLFIVNPQGLWSICLKLHYSMWQKVLLSTRKFVWVLLGPGLGSPGPKQIQPAAALYSGLFSGECVRCIPASLSQRTFPVPVSCRISKCHRDSLGDAAAASVAGVLRSSRWLQLAQGFSSSYCLFLLPSSRWATSQNMNEEWG